MTPDEKRKDVVRHYETEAELARELTHLKNLLAHAVPLKEVEAIQAERDHWKAGYVAVAATLAMIARPTTGYQCWHITAARAALEEAP